MLLAPRGHGGSETRSRDSVVGQEQDPVLAPPSPSPGARHTESAIHSEEKRYLIVSHPNLIKRCVFTSAGEGLLSAAFTSDSDTRKKTPGHRGDAHFNSALERRRRPTTAYSDASSPQVNSARGRAGQKGKHGRTAVTRGPGPLGLLTRAPGDIARHRELVKETGNSSDTLEKLKKKKEKKEKQKPSRFILQIKHKNREWRRGPACPSAPGRDGVTPGPRRSGPAEPQVRPLRGSPAGRGLARAAP